MQVQGNPCSSGVGFPSRKVSLEEKDHNEGVRCALLMKSSCGAKVRHFQADLVSSRIWEKAFGQLKVWGAPRRKTDSKLIRALRYRYPGFYCGRDRKKAVFWI